MDNAQSSVEQYSSSLPESGAQISQSVTPEQEAVDVMVATDNPHDAMEAVVNFQPMAESGDQLAEAFFRGTGERILPSGDSDATPDELVGNFFPNVDVAGQFTEGLDSETDESNTSYKDVDGTNNIVMEPALGQIVEHSLQEAPIDDQIESFKSEVMDIEPDVLEESRFLESAEDPVAAIESKEIFEELQIRLEGSVSKGEGKAVEVLQDGYVIEEPEDGLDDREALLRIELEEKFVESERMSIGELKDYIEEEVKLIDRLKELVPVVEDSDVTEEIKLEMLRVINGIVFERVEAIVNAKKHLDRAEADAEDNKSKRVLNGLL